VFRSFIFIMLSHEGDVLKSRFGDAVAVEVSFDDVEVDMVFVENWE
jgi:hypothetical protein